MEKYEFDVKGMCCESCEQAISESTRSIEGVTGVRADSDAGEVAVMTEEADKEAIRESIEEAGFPVTTRK